MGLTINNLNKFVTRHFEDQALSGLKPNSDKYVINPSLKTGVNGYTLYRGFSPDRTATRSCSCYLLSIPTVRHTRGAVISALCLILFVAILFIGIHDGKVMADKPKSNPHELKEKFESMECANCHRQTPVRIPENNTRAVLPGQDDFVTDPVTMCVPCHEGSMDSHPIAVQPKYLVPADLPLDKKRGISCLTCHYTHGSLKSDRSCCSVSFLDRMFDRERMKKSFLLRRENTNGGLCSACHLNNV